ncbi:MAG: amidase [Betaproteobacteria bacterium]
MSQKPLHELTATEVVAAISAGRASAESVAQSCLERIASREPEVLAWQFLDPDLVLSQARAVDKLDKRGLLHGVPVGMKDIIDTADMPTEYGTPIHAGHRPHMDATCVALTRRAGGVIMGKTVTTEFANRYPGKTRHPMDPSRTPGGSSSGSAAAVGDCMIPLAIGTQTTGSTIRPAAYSGCFGYRPTWGDLRVAGVMEAAGSLDTLGLIARSIEDIVLYRHVLADEHGTPPALAAASAPRVGVCRTQFWNITDAATKTAIETCAATMAKAGAKVTDLTLPPSFDPIEEIHQRISSFEFARNRAWEINHHYERISQTLRENRLKHGLAYTFAEYREARADAEKLRLQLDDIFRDYDIILTPSAPGVAPVGLNATGSAAFSSIWTAAHTPSVTLPLYTGEQNLPVGVQLVARRDRDHALFEAALWTWRAHGR